MKKFLFIKPVIVFILIVFSFVSCNDAVFYAVSLEELPLEPRIAGPSTNFVLFNGKMYVAAKGSIYCYDSTGYENEDYKSGKWSSISAGGRISHLAATTGNLYALDGNRIITYDSGMNLNPDPILQGKNIQGIFAADDILFIGLSDEVYYKKDGGDTAKINASGFSRLCGAAGDAANYYLCSTGGSGMYYKEKTSFTTSGTEITASPVANNVNSNFTGILNLSADQVVAISRTGTLFKVSSAGMTTAASFSDSRRATGALGVWKKGSDSLLLVGRQDMTSTAVRGYTHGYIEIPFTAAGITGSFNEPGRTTPSTMDDHERYVSSISKHALRYFYQAPDGILFTSTNHGVWSYRMRDGKNTWNSEE